jgi:uncharacterized protein
MADYRLQTQTGAGSRTELDAGLRSYMLGVYNYMALGVAFTAVIVMFVASNPALLAAVYSMKWVLFIGTLGLGFFAGKLIFSGNTALAHAAYWGYAALWGLMIAPMVGSFLAINPNMVFQAFLISAITFGGASIAGYVTKRDMSGLGGFFMMACIGLIVAGLLNALVFQSGMFSLILSSVVVLIFSAITAYETQQIKEMYSSGDSPAMTSGKSIFGAFMLYGSFVTIFVHVLNIMGIMGGDE